MERLKRNPAGWGLMLGGATVVFSTFFVWLVVTHADGREARIRAIEDVTGQTILSRRSSPRWRRCRPS